MTTEDLITKLRAALDEDEQRAKRAAWSVADHTYAPVDVDDEKIEMCGRWVSQGVLGIHKRVKVADPGWDPKVTDVVWSEVADHVVAHDPAHVLAMVASHREILELIQVLRDDYQDNVADHLTRALAKGYGIEVGP